MPIVTIRVTPAASRTLDARCRLVARVEVRVRVGHAALRRFASSSMRFSSSAIDGVRIELREERLRLAQRLSRRELARLPAPDPRRVVAGEDDVLVAVVLGHRAELERAGE